MNRSLFDHQGLIGRSSGYIEGLSNDVKKTVGGLRGVDAEYLSIFKQLKKESFELGPRCVFACNRITRPRIKLPLFAVSSLLVSHERSMQPSTRRALRAVPTSSRVSKSQ